MRVEPLLDDHFDLPSGEIAAALHAMRSDEQGRPIEILSDATVAAIAHARSLPNNDKRLKLAVIHAANSPDQAKTFVSHPTISIVKAQAAALSLHPWGNTPEEWLRSEVCLVLIEERRRGR